MTKRKRTALLFLILASLNLLAAISVLLHVGRQNDREKVIHTHAAALTEIPADAIDKIKANTVALALSANLNAQHEVAVRIFALYDHLLRDSNRLAVTLFLVLAANTAFFFGGAYFQLRASAHCGLVRQ
ncbi:hypothetical protein TSACC_22984 [Terrimicrobium sacchariphilum]|uniref:Uncharacterized protein n=1 Tax=Terrimicrobium sacchariphilum TaxID=690879 RepID=A0A146GA91_TERSA|nr:hypothetical protein [Terrimicrobium sacchariphilum]GAT34559.1 hypothetical protein TSACC_22984 [Terrimicrobium sacchariphilum]